MAVNFIGLPVALKYAKGATTNVSKANTPIKRLKYSISKLTKEAISLLNNNTTPRNTIVVMERLINTVENTLSFSLCVL